MRILYWKKVFVCVCVLSCEHHGVARAARKNHRAQRRFLLNRYSSGMCLDLVFVSISDFLWIVGGGRLACCHWLHTRRWFLSFRNAPDAQVRWLRPSSKIQRRTRVCKCTFAAPVLIFRFCSIVNGSVLSMAFVFHTGRLCANVCWNRLYPLILSNSLWIFEALDRTCSRRISCGGHWCDHDTQAGKLRRPLHPCLRATVVITSWTLWDQSRIFAWVGPKP